MTCRRNRRWTNRWRVRNMRDRKFTSIGDKRLPINYSASRGLLQSDCPITPGRVSTRASASYALSVPRSAAHLWCCSDVSGVVAALAGLGPVVDLGVRCSPRSLLDAVARLGRSCGPGRQDRRGGQRHPDRNRSEPEGQLPPSLTRSAAAARHRFARCRLAGAGEQQPADHRHGQRVPFRPSAPRGRPPGVRRRQVFRDSPPDRASGQRCQRSSHLDRPDRCQIGTAPATARPRTPTRAIEGFGANADGSPSATTQETSLLV